ncbi:MAG: hypothetical protein NTY01_24890 [Verrucomicrobia bacterium]|nr:hypothetical protein [Verrucomicrobiota bacterium]
MNDSPQQPPSEKVDKAAAARTEQVTVAGWTGGVSAFFALVTLGQSPTWPAAVGVAAVMAMVAVACYFILRKG